MLPAGIVPPVKVIVRGSVKETVPPQVFVAGTPVSSKTAPGRVSVTLTPVNGDPVGFWSVMVSVVVLPT